MNVEFSVVVPLYNKEREVGAALDSVLGQRRLPREIIVVDDGSTDGGAAVVGGYTSPLIRLVTQKNAGVSAARNRGAVLARSEYIAFLDADDRWQPGYLEKMAFLIEQYPDCGAYAAAFDIVSGDRIYSNVHPAQEGIVPDFFREAMRSYICQPSATVVPRGVFQELGGFPEGMKIGEDLYFWIRLASRYRICFTPENLVLYSRTASNRSAGIYTPERTVYSFEDLYCPQEENSFRNEYIARCAIGKALTLSAKGDTAFGLCTERFFAYTRMYRRGWWKLRLLNRIPPRLRPCPVCVLQPHGMGARPEGFLMPRKGGNTVHSEVSFAAAENRLENRFEEIPEKNFLQRAAEGTSRYKRRRISSARRACFRGILITELPEWNRRYCCLSAVCSLREGR